jgi:hypothetical protein
LGGDVDEAVVNTRPGQRVGRDDPLVHSHLWRTLMDRCSDLIEQIDAQLKNLLTARAIFPYMREHLVGATECATAPFYRNRGFNITFFFAEPLTAPRIAEFNQIGHWINQNYIVRLYALLESFHVISDTISINT